MRGKKEEKERKEKTNKMTRAGCPNKIRLFALKNECTT
jgi:hypothetical protein